MAFEVNVPGLSDVTNKILGDIKNFKDAKDRQYPNVKVCQTVVGHKIELNETEGNESVTIRHGTTGAFVKMFANGDIELYSPRDINVAAARHVNIKNGTTMSKKKEDNNDRMVINVTGNAHLLVENNMHVHVKGNKYERIDGEYLLTVGNKFITAMGEGAVNSRGLYAIDVSRFTTNGSTIERNLKAGGTMRDSFAGTYIIEQTSPGGVLRLSSLGDIEMYALGSMRTNIVGDADYTIGGKVNYNIAGLRTIVPTGANGGPLAPTQPAFNINIAAGAYSCTTVLGNVTMTASIGTMKLFAGGPFLDVDCLTGVYLN
jgi:hypothetical protein